MVLDYLLLLLNPVKAKLFFCHRIFSNAALKTSPKMSALETLFQYIDEHQDLYVQVSFFQFFPAAWAAMGY